MANTGNVFAGTGENNAGIGATAWTNPGNVTADDQTDATCNAAASSQYLVARNFNFSAIPDGSVIRGVTVRVEASEHSANNEVVTLQLQDAGGALFGSTKTDTISGTGKAVYTLGGTADLWGATLTAAIVKDADFGVRAWFTTSHDVRVDYVTMAVEYAEPATGTLSSTTAAVTLSGAGTAQAQVNPSGSLSSTVGAITATATGSLSIAGSGVGTLAAATLAATGSTVIAGSLATTLGGTTLAATGSAAEETAITGTLSATTDAVSVAAAGAAAISGSLSSTIGAATLTAAGEMAGTGTATGTFTAATDAMTVAAAGAATITGQMSATAESATLAAAGTVAIAGTATAALGAASLSATGIVHFAGALSISTGAVTLVAAGGAAVSGALEVVIGAGGQGGAAPGRRSRRLGFGGLSRRAA